MASWFVILGSVFLVASVYDSLTTLNSVDMREEIGRVLASGSGQGLGLGVDGAVSIMRVALMVAGACAAAAAVLGVYVLQRHRQARIALSVVAVPLLLTAPFTGGLFGALVAAATLTLWTGPARDWFAGRPVRESPRQLAERREDRPAPSRDLPPAPEAPRVNAPSSSAPPAPPLSTASPSSAPGATQGFGRTEQQLPSPPAWAPQNGDQQGDQQPYPASWGPHGHVARPTVPTQVKVACLLTWVFSGGLTVLYGLAVLMLVAAPDRLLSAIRDTPEWQRANLPEDVLLPGLWLATLVVLAWTISACVLAVLVWRRNNWARWLLATSAGFALLLAMFAFPVGLPHQIACAVAIGALFGPASRAWFSQRG
jgi:hypothetical protein